METAVASDDSDVVLRQQSGEVSHGLRCERRGGVDEVGVVRERVQQRSHALLRERVRIACA